MVSGGRLRALGLDLGSKRIGVALSDATGTIATPFTVLLRAHSRNEDHRQIASLVRDEEIDIVVVGLPLSMDGRVGKAAQTAIDEARALATVLDVPVETCDERLTTKTAQSALTEAGVRARRGREVVDKVAAAVILQAWLDARGQRAGGPDR